MRRRIRCIREEGTLTIANVLYAKRKRDCVQFAANEGAMCVHRNGLNAVAQIVVEVGSVGIGNTVVDVNQNAYPNGILVVEVVRKLAVVVGDVCTGSTGSAVNHRADKKLVEFR